MPWKVLASSLEKSNAQSNRTIDCIFSTSLTILDKSETLLASKDAAPSSAAKPKCAVAAAAPTAAPAPAVAPVAAPPEAARSRSEEYSLLAGVQFVGDDY